MIVTVRSGERSVSRLNSEHLQLLCRILASPGCTIVSLSLVGSFGHLIASDKALFLSALAKNKSITSLNLSGNRLGDEFCLLLTNTLLENQTLSTLDLSHNLITDEGIGHLEWLFCGDSETFTKVSSLDLSYNLFGLSGTQAMVNVLETNRTLRKLDLRHNNYLQDRFETFVGKWPIKAKVLKDNKMILDLRLTPWEVAFCPGCCKYGCRMKYIDDDHHEGQVDYDSECVVNWTGFGYEYKTKWIDWSDSEKIQKVLLRNRIRAGILCLLAIHRFRVRECLLGQVPKDVVLVIAKKLIN